MIVAGTAALCLIMAASVLFFHQDYVRTIDSEAIHLKRLSQSVVNQLDVSLGEIELMFKVLDAWLNDNPGADPRFDPAFLSLVNAFRSHHNGMIDIRLVDDSGGLYYLPTTSAVPLANGGDREYVAAQRDPNRRGFFLGAPVQSRVNDTWLVPISYPITLPRHGLSVMYATLEYQTLERMFGPIKPEASGSITLIRKDGMVLFDLPERTDFVGKPLANISAFEHLRSGTANGEILASKDTRDVPLLMAWSDSIVLGDRGRYLQGLHHAVGLGDGGQGLAHAGSLGPHGAPGLSDACSPPRARGFARRA